MLPGIKELLNSGTLQRPSGQTLAQSREGRPVDGYRFGSGATRIGLIAGCHADEPVGPLLLEALVRYLSTAPPDSEALTRFDWWIVPHINPDGAERNRAWSGTGVGDAGSAAPDAYDFATYLRHVVRELPGDDIEFGFPRGGDDTGARPEPRAVYDWWQSDPRPFSMHMSLHGMAFAAGPWYLIEPAWADRSDIIIERCSAAAADMGYRLHDVERNGEKGFTRIARGFCTRPDSVAMAAYFHTLGDDATASLFRPSSMETIRTLGGGGGDALTLVSEMPLFTLPGVGDTIEPVDPLAEEWRGRIMAWKVRLDKDPASIDAVRYEATAEGIRPVPIRDQLELQWRFICAGIEQSVA